MSETWSASIRAWNVARLLRAACLLMVGLAAPAPAAATTYTWNGPSGGAWNGPCELVGERVADDGDSERLWRQSHRERRRERPRDRDSRAPSSPVLQQLQVNGSTGLISIVGLPSLALLPAPPDSRRSSSRAWAAWS